MPELKEVFEMVSQKIEPDTDAWKQQDDRHRRTMRNRRIGAFALVAAIGSIAAILAVTLSRVERPTDVGNDPPVTHAPGVYLVELESGQRFLVPGLDPNGDSLDVSWDGMRVTFASGSAGDSAVHIADRDGGNERILPRTGASPGGAWAPRWSPDGATIVYQAKGHGELTGNLFSVDVVTGETTQLTDLPATTSPLWYMAPSYAPDGETIFFMMPGGSGVPSGSWNVWSIPATGGDPRLVRRNAGFPSISPDGSDIAYVGLRSDPTSGEVQFGDLIVAGLEGGGTVRRLVEGPTVTPVWSPDGSRLAYQTGDGFRGGEAAYVVDVRTGATALAFDEPGFPEWFDGDKLIAELTG